MNFLKRNKRGIILLVAILLLLALNSFGKQVKNVFYLAATPFQRGLFLAGQKTAIFFNSILNLVDLIEQNQRLENENQALKSQLVELKELEIENQLLRNALDLKMQEDFKLLLARIIVKDFNQETILIDRGGRDYVAEKMLVISSQRALVGEVSEVYDNFSRVRLITGKESAFPARIQESDATGTLKGGGSGQLFLERLDLKAEVQSGQLVVTTDLESDFPPGLLLGEIKTVEKSDLASFQRASVKPSFNLYNASSLFLILDFISPDN